MNETSLKNYSIFKFGQNRHALEDNKKYFIKSTEISIWREEFQLIDYDSFYEKSFLEKLFPYFSNEIFATFLNLTHESLYLSIEIHSVIQVQKICKDLEFIKDHIDLDKQILEYLVVPISSNRLERAKQTTQTRVLNYDFRAALICKKKLNFVDIEFIHRTLNIQNILDKLKWEIFLNKIGCLFPNVENPVIDHKSIEYLIQIKDEILVDAITNISFVAKNLIKILEKNNHIHFYRSSGIKRLNAMLPENKMFIDQEIKLKKNAVSYFSDWLQEKLCDEYISENNLRSTLSGNGTCDDLLGYDFYVKDTFNKLGYGENKECFIEVKGISGKFSGKFLMSQSEFNTRRRLIGQKQKIYLIVLIEDADKEVPEIFKWITSNDEIKWNEKVFLFEKVFLEVDIT